VWCSNPRPERRAIASYGYGMDTIPELIGGLEDVRRFDMCLITAADDVSTEQINMFNLMRNGHHCQHTGDLCRALILWSWTRTAEQCILEKEIAKRCIDEAIRLSKLFTDSVPIVDRGSMRYKIARLSASLAARTFSTTDDRQQLVVRESHVEYVSRMLERVYSKPSFGYLEYTKATRATEELHDPDTIRKTIASLSFPYDFIDSALRTEQIDARDVSDWCGCKREESQIIISLLVRKHALKRDGFSYRKTSAFVAFLRGLLESREIPERPDHIPESEF
jgi:hypothetical protein